MAELLDEKHLQTYANVGIIIKDYNYIANGTRVKVTEVPTSATKPRLLKGKRRNTESFCE